MAVQDEESGARCDGGDRRKLGYYDRTDAVCQCNQVKSQLPRGRWGSIILSYHPPFVVLATYWRIILYFWRSPRIGVLPYDILFISLKVER